MANVPKAITDLPVASAMGDDDLLVVSQNATTSSIKGELIKGYAQNAVASQVTAAQTAANQAGQSATQAEAARQGAAAAQTAAENAQDAAETARDQSVAAAGTIGDSVEQAQDAASQASSAKDAAVAAQTAAETAKTAAETASGQAQTAATQAAGSATAAQTAATQAGDAKTDAETARNEAETSASSAANSASDAENAATEAEQSKTYIENMNMEGETLPAGSSVTVTKTTSPEGDLLFVIGVPQGIQGDKGETGETGATGPQGVSVTNATVNEDGDLVITLSAGEPINAGSVIGPKGEQGDVGPTGASVDRIERTSGTGAPGTTDTYAVYLTNGQTGGTFQVYNGSNGTGSGDFMADGSVPMTGDLQMGGHVVTGMADGTEPTDGATVGQLSGKLDSPAGGTAGQVLTKTADGSSWENAPSGLPDGGTEGQMLYKSADGAAWGDKPVMAVRVSATGSQDKTISEIFQAYQNNYAIYCVLDDELVLYPAVIKKDYAMFACIHNLGSSPTDIGDLKFYVVYIDDSGIAVSGRSELSSLFLENPTGGTTGQVLTKTSTGEEWSDAPSGLPEGGTEGQVLKRGASGAEWDDAEWLPLSGGTVSGDIELLYSGGRLVFNSDAGGNPVVLRRIKSYVDSDVYNKISFGEFLGGSSYGNVIITGIETPVASSDATNKNYVDIKLSTKLTTPTGTQGQLLGFTADNTVGAVDAPESGLTQEQADERYLQLSGGTMTNTLNFNIGSYGFGTMLKATTQNGDVGIVANDKQNVTVMANDLYVQTDGGATTSNKVVVQGDLDEIKATYVTVTLTTSGWSSNTQTVTVSGVVASETAQLITPTPAIASQSAYYEAGIMCTNQGTNSLTFTCQTVPTSNLTVYVVIQPLS